MPVAWWHNWTWSAIYMAGGGALAHFGAVMWLLDDGWFIRPRFDGWHPSSEWWNVAGPAMIVAGILLALPRRRGWGKWTHEAQDYLAIAVGIVTVVNAAISFQVSLENHTAPIISSELLPFGVMLFVTGMRRSWGGSIR